MPVWALVNLILSVVGLALTVLLTVWVLLQRKQKQKKQPQAKQTSAKQDKYSDKQREEKETEKQKRYRTIWFALGVILGILGIVVFLLTEDLSRPMALVDNWTIVNAIILAIQILAIVLTFKHKNKKDPQDNEQEEHNSSFPH